MRPARVGEAGCPFGRPTGVDVKTAQAVLGHTDARVIVLATIAAACGEDPGLSADGEAAPQACDVPDGDTADGPVSVTVEPFTHEPGTVDYALSGRATVTNTSDTTVQVDGDGGDIFYAFLVNGDGGLLTTSPEAKNAAAAMAVLAPGESVEWRTLLTPRLCGEAAGSPVPAGNYDAHVWVRLRVGDTTGREELLSVESVPVDVA